MGYTTQSSRAMIGLGASSISDIWGAFAQNAKDVEAYKTKVFYGILPVEKGHVLTEKDLFVREQILNMMCHFAATWTEAQFATIDSEELQLSLQEMEADGILELRSNGLLVKERALVRNICMVFDQYLSKNLRTEKLFSQTI
jgi:oxygen-independent coproporphyrinogen-3 oxidase